MFRPRMGTRGTPPPFLSSCGAELICDENTAATSCPYCGNPTVVPGQFSGQLRPDFIIPFKLSKEDAVKALKDHYKGKIFLPKSFTQENHVQEIQGIYVPFWMLAMPVTKPHAPIHTAPVTMRSRKRNTMTSTGPDFSLLRKYRRMPPVKCRTITWTPSSPTTIRN